MTTLAQMGRVAHERWLSDPTTFCHDVLGFVPWDLPGHDSQAEMIRAVPYHKRISTRSGHKCGKSVGCAAIALWAYCCLPGAQVVLTAPTFPQVEKILWKEVRNLYRHARLPIGGTLHLKPGSGLYNSVTGSHIFGRTARTPEGMQGVSGRFVFYIADEASGINQDIMEAIEGNMSGGAWLIMISNPTQVTGEFFDSHHSKREFYKCFHFNSETVATRVNPHGEIPGLAKPSDIRVQKKKYGADSPFFEIRARGNFPGDGENSIVGLKMVLAAQRRWTGRLLAEQKTKRLIVGVDPARFGSDESVIAPKRGLYVYPMSSRGKVDGPQLGRLVVDTLDSIRDPMDGTIAGPKLPAVCMDESAVGASCMDWLNSYQKRHPGAFELVGLQGAMSADNTEEYGNLRAEMWFGVRDFLKSGGSLPPDEKLKSDLMAVGYKFDRVSRFLAEPKDDVKKRLGRSPDRGDALSHAVYGATGGFVQRALTLDI